MKDSAGSEDEWATPKVPAAHPRRVDRLLCPCLAYTHACGIAIANGDRAPTERPICAATFLVRNRHLPESIEGSRGSNPDRGGWHALAKESSRDQACRTPNLYRLPAIGYQPVEAHDRTFWYKTGVARIDVDGGALVLRLSALEKAISFGGDRRLPLGLIRNVEEVPHAGSTVRDTPTFVPRHRFGTMMPGVLMYGSIMTVAGWDLLAVIGDRPSVRVDFSEGSPFSRLIASVRGPGPTLGAIRAALPEDA